MSRKHYRGVLVAALMAIAGVVGTPNVSLAEEPQKASVVDTSGLSAEKLKQIQDIVDSGKSVTQQVTEAVSPEALTSYAEIGKAVGSSVAEAAKAIGMVAADFSNTWLGKVAIFMIVWKLMLADIVSGATDVLIGSAWLITILVIWTRYFRKICLVESTTTETVDRRIKDAAGNFVKDADGNFETEKVTSVIVKGQDLEQGAVMVYRLVMFALLAVGTIPAWIFFA